MQANNEIKKLRMEEKINKLDIKRIYGTISSKLKTIKRCCNNSLNDIKELKQQQQTADILQKIENVMYSKEAIEGNYISQIEELKEEKRILQERNRAIKRELKLLN